MSTLQTKADYRDIDGIGQKMHNKMDLEKAQLMISDIKQEVHQNLSDNKQHLTTMGKELEQDVKKL